MKAFSEYVSLGHPDKIADYISQYLLDRYIEQDPDTKYAVEVQIKNYKVTLGGEVSSTCKFSKNDITKHVRDAVNDIGYTKEYAEKWGYDNTVCGDLLEVDGFINQQSPDIAQGLDGWGDQGIFFGYADYAPQYSGMPKDHTIAKRLCKALFESGIGGLDIKTQVVTNDGDIETIIVAIPLLEDGDRKKVKKFIKHRIKGRYKLIINGTGRYVRHSHTCSAGRLSAHACLYRWHKQIVAVRAQARTGGRKGSRLPSDRVVPVNRWRQGMARTPIKEPAYPVYADR